MNKIHQLTLLSLLAIGSANAQIISVTDSTTAITARVSNVTDVEATISGWGLDGGNTVVVLFGAENSDGITATYAGQSMTVVNNYNGGDFLSSFAYLINPTASTGDVVINANYARSPAAGNTRLSSAYAVFSLSNVGSLAGSDSLTAAGNLDYTTTADGGYALLVASANNFSGPAPTVTATNADLTLFSGAVDGNMATVFAHGDVATAGTYAEALSGSNFDTGSLVAFDAVPEPSAFALLAGCFGFTWVMLRRRA